MDGSHHSRDGCAGRRRGRPPLDPGARETRILDALERLIAERGVRAASMAGVARAAGMSKRTLYALHPTLDALFEAWVSRLRDSHVRPLRAGEARDRPLAERLRLLLGRQTPPEDAERRLVALRAVIAEAPNNPPLARAFRRGGIEAARAIVADELARAAEAGEIAVADPRAAAALLCDMAWPSLVDRLLDPAAAPPALEESDARLDLAIRVFLGGVAPP